MSQPNPFGPPGDFQVPPSIPRSPFPPRPSSLPMVSMILGIISCVMWGPVGLVLGILALHFSKKGELEMARGLCEAAAPSYLKTGRVCGTVGICIGGVFTAFMCIWFAVVVAFIGAAAAGAAGAAGRHSGPSSPTHSAPP